MAKIVSLKQRQYEKFYSDKKAVGFDLSKDTVYKKPSKKDIRKQMIKGYMELLSNFN